MPASRSSPTPTTSPITDIYGAEVEGEVQIKTRRPAADACAAARHLRPERRRLRAPDGREPLRRRRRRRRAALAYAAPDTGVRDLGVVDRGGISTGVAENVTVMPKTKLADEAGLGRSERIVTVQGGRRARGSAAQERLRRADLIEHDRRRR